MKASALLIEKLLQRTADLFLPAELEALCEAVREETRAESAGLVEALDLAVFALEGKRDDSDPTLEVINAALTKAKGEEPMSDAHRQPIPETTKKELRESYARHLSRCSMDDLEEMLRLHNFATMQLLRDPKDRDAQEYFKTTCSVISTVLERMGGQ